MAIKFLTIEQHQEVLKRLITLARSVEGTRYHPAGPEYTSLMSCFLMHNLSAGEALLYLCNSFKIEWFPSTVGYVIVRSMFETEVTAHYISQSPKDRSRQYIEFEHVLNKRDMEGCIKHRKSKNHQWREAMNLMWRDVWSPKEKDINTKYLAICSNYETVTKKGKRLSFQNWSGKSIRQMAIEVDHEEAYDIFYGELSSFTHVDVRLANKFLRIRPDGLSWSQRSRQFDVGNVFRHAASFLTCFFELFAEQFDVWSKDEVLRCWDVEQKI
ncbi:MAG: DUF5677 domain-containing protein [Syntrophales bacterium]|nr:DUF5677 domain-containing protein [Syntrophales bacterium]